MNYNISTIHFVYVISMIIGALIIFNMSRNPKGVPKIDYVISIIIPVWSAIAYLMIVFDQGYITIGGETIFYARYLDWIVTTPLLLVALCFTGMYYTKKDNVLIISVVSADIIMIVSGLIGDISTGIYKYIWFAIGVCSFLVVLYITWGPVKNIAKSQGEELYKLYNFLLIYLTILWIGYPTGWILGPSGIGLWGTTIDSYVFTVLPVFSKVGFGILDVTGLRKLNEVKQK